MNNYHSLLNIKYKYSIFNISILLIIFITLILLSVIFTYSSFKILGIYNDDQIVISVPVENSDSVKNGTYLMIDNVKYDYRIIDISPIKEMNYVNYQDYNLKINDVSLKENEVVEITFHYNKQRIIKKIIDIIF